MSDPVAFILTLYLCEESHWFCIVPWPLHPLLSIPFQWIAVCQQRSAAPSRPRRPHLKAFSARSSFLHVLPVAPAASSETSSLRWHRILAIRRSLPKSALDCFAKAVKFLIYTVRREQDEFVPMNWRVTRRRVDDGGCYRCCLCRKRGAKPPEHLLMHIRQPLL